MTYLFLGVCWVMKKHIKWNKVDWDVTDVVISGMVGVSRERVRQKRKDIISILKRSKDHPKQGFKGPQS